MTARLQVKSRTVYAGVRRDDAAGGPYERIDGIFTFAVDPQHAANRAIADLGLARTHTDGCVHIEADVVILRPVDPPGGSTRVLVEATNRGRRIVPWILNRAGPPAPADPGIPSGDGFLFRHGFSVVFLGWQWDVPRDGVLLGLDAPRARSRGGHVRGHTVVEIRPNVAERTRRLADGSHQALPVHDVDEADAVLTVRDWDDDKPRVISRDRWAFVRETDQGLVPSRHHITLFDGFEPGRHYHVRYTAAEAPVAGCGLLALREAASFVRSPAADNPLAGHAERVHAFGMSQAGRLLRHFVYLGLNRTPAGTPAYDGMLIVCAGAQRGEFNHRFAHPSVQATPGPGHRFPFADVELDDPYGAADRDGLLKRQQQLGCVPKIMAINTSAEYWRGDASLTHIDPTGTRDLDPPEDVRLYAIASTQHLPGSIPQHDVHTSDRSRGRYGFNVVDFTPVPRAALLHLDAWVGRGVDPPPSRVPTLTEGTAVPRSQVLGALSMFRDLHLPDLDRLPSLRTVDPDPRVDGGTAPRRSTGRQVYPAVVSAVDPDGNEVAGIQLPDARVPLGTHTGWNPRHPSTGGSEQLAAMHGFTWFFSRTRAERQRHGDPRLSLEERYAGRDEFRKRAQEAAEALASDGYVLAEDVPLLVADALARWDYVMLGDHGPYSPFARR